jgi:hypothetical protein
MNITDLRPTVVPKSDQLNAEQLLTAPLTITVNKVSVANSPEQPVVINYDGDNGRPYKPCKTMRKLLIYAWGQDGSQWVGRSMTLYNNPEVKFGGELVGGIRISHLSHIPADISVSLTATRGKKSKHSVLKLAAVSDPLAAARDSLTSANDMPALIAAWGKLSAAEKTQLASVKDARKQQIESAAPAADDKSQETL